MKVIETQSAVLSNYEVLMHIQSVHERYSEYPGYKSKTESSKYRPLATVVSDVQEYLLHDKSPLSATSTAVDDDSLGFREEAEEEQEEEEAPGGGDGGKDGADQQNKPRKKKKINPHYNDKTPRRLLQELAPFNLTKSELLIILNLRPKDVAALDAMVEECDERLSAEQQEEIITIVAQVLGRPKEEDGEEVHQEERDAA